AQAEQVFKNIHRILTGCGASIGDIVKLNWYFRDMGDRAVIAAARDRFLGTHRPASTAVEVSRLVNEDWLLEVDCVAAVTARSASARRHSCWPPDRCRPRPLRSPSGPSRISAVSRMPPANSSRGRLWSATRSAAR